MVIYGSWSTLSWLFTHRPPLENAKFVLEREQPGATVVAATLVRSEGRYHMFAFELADHRNVCVVFREGKNGYVEWKPGMAVEVLCDGLDEESNQAVRNLNDWGK